MKEYKQGNRLKYASVKRDGHNTTFHVSGGMVMVFTRTGKSITHKMEWYPAYHRLQSIAKRDSELQFHGELWVPGKDASYIPTAICQKDKNLKFDVFGCGHLPVGTPLEEVLEAVRDVGLLMIPWWDFGYEEATTLFNPSHRDVEGYVFSDGNMLNQQKLKPMKTCDLIMTGVSWGEGKYSDTIGAVKVSTFDGEEMASISGMTDAERDYIAQNYQSLRGRVVEVKYQKVGAKGRLRHPVFVRFRDDKAPQDCTVEQFR